MSRVGSVRTQVEDAIVELLLPLRPEHVEAVAIYAGELQSEDLGDVKQALLGKFPGILVTTGRATYKDASTSIAVMDLEIELFLCGLGLRSRERIGRGNPGGRGGIYRLGELVRDRLFRVQLPIDGVGTVRLGSDAVLVHRPDFAIWKSVYTCPVDIMRPEADDEELLSIAGKFNLPADEDTRDEEDQAPIVETLTTREGA